MTDLKLNKLKLEIYQHEFKRAPVEFHCYYELYVQK
jgi:hypothetical protein